MIQTEPNLREGERWERGDKRGRRGVLGSYLLSGQAGRCLSLRMRNPDLKVGLPSSSADECEKADWEQQQQQSPRTTTSQDPATSTDPAMHDPDPPSSSPLFEKHLVSTIDIETIGLAASFGDDSEKKAFSD